VLNCRQTIHKVACCGRVIHNSSHASLTEWGISWNPTLSAQEKHGYIMEYLKRNEFDKTYLK